MQFDFRNLEREGFTYWMFVNLVNSQNMEQWDRLRELTDNWRDINITMQINGEEVDAGRFIDLVQRSLNARAEVEAKQFISDALPNLEKLQDELDVLQEAIKDKVNRWAQENDIDIDIYRQEY